MEKLQNYDKIIPLANQITVEKVYPLSMIEGSQSGEIFVNDAAAPTAALFWHYCGFGFIAGHADENFMTDVCRMMQAPLPDHHDRLVLQTEADLPMAEVLGLKKQERYVFVFDGVVPVSVPGGCDLCAITRENYDLIRGRISPAFSWKNADEFIENGFGFCLMKDGQVLANAFSAAVSRDCVDIGVETFEPFRGKGYGRVVADAMVRETLQRGKTPVWACNVQNEASAKLAGSVGFRIIGTHPWYKI